MQDFAAIDFETANGRRSSVCSIGVVIVRDGKIVDKFYIAGLPLVAHNRPFDESCLKAAFEEYGMEYPRYEFYCTLHFSQSGSPFSNDKRNSRSVSVIPSFTC